MSDDKAERKLARRYRRLCKHIPALKQLPSDEAVALFDRCHKAETTRIQPWPRILVIAACFVFGLCLWVSHAVVPDSRWPSLVWGVVSLMFAMYFFKVHDRADRRVRTLIKTAAATGRLSKCLDCGYDLRFTESDCCPECGASAVIELPFNDQRI